MARINNVKRLNLDEDVRDLIQRAGASSNTLGHVKEYSVDRPHQGPTTVTMTFFADEQFSAVLSNPIQEEVA